MLLLTIPTGANDTYQLIFLKTLWIDVIVGQDHRADVTFHYPQVREFCRILLADLTSIGISKIFARVPQVDI